MANDAGNQNEPAKNNSKAGWLFGLVVVVVIGIVIGKDSFNAIDWQEDYQTAVKMAKEQDKPVLIFFYSDKDEQSKRMKKVYLNLSVAKYVGGTYIPVRLDIKDSKNSEAVSKFSVISVPESVIYLPGKDVSGMVSGFVSVKEFSGRLEVVRKRLKKTSD